MTHFPFGLIITRSEEEKNLQESGMCPFAIFFFFGGGGVKKAKGGCLNSLNLTSKPYSNSPGPPVAETDFQGIVLIA